MSLVAEIWETLQEQGFKALTSDTPTQYTETLYGHIEGGESPDAGDGGEKDGIDDIEANIKDEIKDLNATSRQALFQPVKIDVRCGMWAGQNPS